MVDREKAASWLQLFPNVLTLSQTGSNRVKVSQTSLVEKAFGEIEVRVTDMSTAAGPAGRDTAAV